MSDAQKRANQKQDKERAGKRAQVWLEQADQKALDKIARREGLPSRIATIRWMMEQCQ